MTGGDPYLVTFLVLDGRAECRTEHCYLIKNCPSGLAALNAARRLADSPTERTTRNDAPLDPQWHQVVRINTLFGVTHTSTGFGTTA